MRIVAENGDTVAYWRLDVKGTDTKGVNVSLLTPSVPLPSPKGRVSNTSMT
ncbi:hypothetical protein POL68_25520 [Stigmatella sp. ncwal1]|uniref:Uncharacterized protein n=1 Tax=Stigmatella ashevillensis TaxID=2995309 RepID=A0ABT5DFF0_9BACT|nr:hypothetical protein [Stigmatella ashevillena]MDC0711853.1 hypothetical protein [Stigmatella ashevillena]